MRQQIDQAEDKDPDAVNEVPVHFGGLDREMVFGGEIAAQGAQQADDQEDYADCDVQAVEAGQHKEGGAEDGGRLREMVAKQTGILIHLAAQENGSQQRG